MAAMSDGMSEREEEEEEKKKKKKKKKNIMTSQCLQCYVYINGTTFTFISIVFRY